MANTGRSYIEVPKAVLAEATELEQNEWLRRFQTEYQLIIERVNEVRTDFLVTDAVRLLAEERRASK